MAYQLSAGPITAHTKGEVKRLRKNGFVPVSIQHRGQETLHLQEEARPLEEFIRRHGKAALLELVIEPDQQRQQVLVRDIQRHPVTHRLVQVTFQGIVRGESIKTYVQIVFQGEPDAVRHHTAIVQHQTEQIEIRCLPGNLPEHITLDVSGMGHGESLRVSDLPASDKYEILTAPDTILVSLASLAAQIAAEDAADQATEAAEASNEAPL